MAEKFELTIYIEKEVKASGRLGNLTLGRRVNGTVNVIFQSRNKAQYREKNNFAWTQKYAIGTSDDFIGEGALVSGANGPVEIKMGQYIDLPDSSNLPDPQDAVKGDGYMDTPDWDKTFAVKNKIKLDASTSVVLYCQTGEGHWETIYVDEPATLGTDYTSYQVQDTYLVSFASSTMSAGVWTKSWEKAPHEFTIDKQLKKKCLSFGRPQGETDVKTACWFEYNDGDDPMGHRKNFPGNKFLAGRQQPPDVPSPGADSQLDISTPVRFRLEFQGKDKEEKEKLANLLWSHIDKSTKGYLDSMGVYIGEYIYGYLMLKSGLSFKDMVPGQTQRDKTIFSMNNLLGSIDPKFAPVSISWDVQDPGKISV